MNYKKVIALIKEQGFDIKSVVSDIGMSYDGFKKSIENCTIEARKLIKLCEILQISPNELLDFNTNFKNKDTFIQTGGVGNSQMNQVNSDVVIAALERQLTEKDKQITALIGLLNK